MEKGTKKFDTKKQKDNKQKETSFDIEKAEKQSKTNRQDFGEMKNKKRKSRGA